MSAARCVLCATLVFLTISPLSAEGLMFNIENLLSAETAAELREKRTLSAVAFGNKTNTLRYCPNTPFGSYAIEKGRVPFAYKGESLYLVPKKTAQNEITEVADIIKSISSLEGIQYYSNLSRRMETLYKASYMVDNPVDRKRIPDFVGVMPENRLYYYYQNDHNLGECVYAVNFWQSGSEVAMRGVNTSPIKLGPVTAIKEGNISLYILVADAQDDLAVYILIQATMVSLPFVDQRIQKSFTSRVDAVYNWLIEKYTQITVGGQK